MDDYYNSILGDDILDDSRVGDIQGDTALIRLKERQSKQEFFSSKEFKEAEKERRESLKPKEHEVRGFNRVWCPIYEKVRPEWLCANECGADVHEVLDVNESEE